MLFIFFISFAFATTVTETRECIVSCARDQLGKPYVFGDEGPDTFDCSGLVMYCYEQCGYKFKERPIVKTFYDMGPHVKKSELILADLVFPSEGHVQIYSGNGNGIHAPKTGDVVKEVAIYGYWGGRRLIVEEERTNES